MRNFIDRALSFAHLGVAPAAKSEKNKDGEDAEHAETQECEEDEGESTASAETDDAKDDKKDGKKGEAKKAKGKAEKSDESDDDEEDGDDEDDGDDKKDAKASAAYKRGRKAERSRTAAVLGNPASARNMELAAKLLCTTTMSSNAIVALLESTPAARGGLNDRMKNADDKNLGAGGGSELKGPAAIEASWAEANKDFMPRK